MDYLIRHSLDLIYEGKATSVDDLRAAIPEITLTNALNQKSLYTKYYFEVIAKYVDFSNDQLVLTEYGLNFMQNQIKLS